MFFSLRLAALTLSTTTLFISHAFGLAIPLVERFVPFSSSIDMLHILTVVYFLRSEQLCNGHPELCDRSYGNITFVGAHDSFAYSPNPFARKKICKNAFRCGKCFLTNTLYLMIQFQGLKRWMLILS